MERNDFNEIEIYQLYYRKKLYCDWTTTCEVLDQKSTNLFRLISKLETFTEIPTVRYKNRKYFLTEWVTTKFWKTVNEAHSLGKL